MVEYIVKIEPKNHKEYNPIHDIVQGSPAVILEARVGERAWFAYKLEEDEFHPWHRVHTSLVENIEELVDKIVLNTENTKYSFVRVKE